MQTCDTKPYLVKFRNSRLVIRIITNSRWISAIYSKKIMSSYLVSDVDGNISFSDFIKLNVGKIETIEYIFFSFDTIEQQEH